MTENKDLLIPRRFSLNSLSFSLIRSAFSLNSRRLSLISLPFSSDRQKPGSHGYITDRKNAFIVH